MENNYSLEELCDMFLEHAEKYLDDQKERVDNFAKNFPGEELPRNLADDFVLPLALASICYEIIQLKKSIEHKQAS